ncbi:MAG: PhoH family protein [Lachnospiraceae bacterium]|nr:PhoH family protein [Lachnospiraceae bacterium]
MKTTEKKKEKSEREVTVKQKKKQKLYVLDTNVLMADPECLDMFENNTIIIPDMVIEELDDHKKDMGDKGYNTRQALRKFDELRHRGNLVKGVKTENGGLIRVVSDGMDTVMPEGWKDDKPDNRILRIAKYYSENSDCPVVLVSKDTNVRIKSDIVGVRAEDYKHERIDEDHLLYNGRADIQLSGKEFDKFAAGEAVDCKKAKFDKSQKDTILQENEFVCITNQVTNGTMLGKVKNGKLVKLQYDYVHPFGVNPRNAGQRFAIEALLAPASELPLVILKGSAGTAKTFLTLACGLQQCAEENIYRKITISRANVEFDKDIGALPGDEESKVGPLLRGCMDNLEFLVDAKSVKNKGGKEDDIRSKVDFLFSHGYISAEALGFLRGRSLTRQILYVDEAQNTSPSQMKGILTRVGEGTKLVISGDLNQIDNTRLDKHNNGLAYALKLMAGDPLCSVVGFTDSETTRSPLAAKVAGLI